MWIEYVSAIPDGGDPAGPAAIEGWTLKMTLRFCFFVFLCFSLFTVSFELTTGSLILLLLLLLLYFIQMFYCYFRYNSALSGMPKSLCMCVLSYVLTIADMSSCTQSTQCWLQTDISVNFKQYPTFHKTIKYSNIHESLDWWPSLSPFLPFWPWEESVSSLTDARESHSSGFNFLGWPRSLVPFFAITGVLDIDGILAEMCNSISDKDRFRPD